MQAYYQFANMLLRVLVQVSLYHSFLILIQRLQQLLTKICYNKIYQYDTLKKYCEKEQTEQPAYSYIELNASMQRNSTVQVERTHSFSLPMRTNIYYSYRKKRAQPFYLSQFPTRNACKINLQNTQFVCYHSKSKCRSKVGAL